MERHILREGASSCPISSSCSQGVPTLAPLANSIVRDDTNASYHLRILGSTFDSDRTDFLNLTVWFSYHVVFFRLHSCSTGPPRRTTNPLFTNHNVAACQSTRGHQERTHNPCQQSLYNNSVWIDCWKKCIIFQNSYICICIYLCMCVCVWRYLRLLLIPLLCLTVAAGRGRVHNVIYWISNLYFLYLIENSFIMFVN